VVAQGTAAELAKVPDSLTGEFLAGTRTIEVPSKRRRPTGYLSIQGASQHNLKNIDVKVPLGVLCCVTGVSGSGKSTLVNEVLHKAVSNRLHKTRQRAGSHPRITGLDQLDKIISVDQSPRGRPPRSNPATYIGLFAQSRALTPEVRRPVETLTDGGVGYTRLGQPATTLSGGEAQRVKLAAELCKVATGRTLYILDEPTTGLHFADTQRLLEVLDRLVQAGN